MKRCFTIISLCFTFLFFGIHIFSQPILNFTHYNTKDGLTHHTIGGKFQDSYGFMWFLPLSGKKITRFDGARFISFSLPGSERSTFFFEDTIGDRKMILLKSDGLFWYFNIDDYSFSALTDQYGDTLSGESLVKDETNRYWILNQNQIIIFDPENAVIVDTIILDNKDKRVAFLYDRQMKGVWLQTSKQLHFISKNKPTKGYHIGFSTTPAFFTNDNKIAYFKYDYCLHVFNPENDNFDSLATNFVTNRARFQPTNVVKDQKGNYWFGNTDIVRYESDKGTFQLYINQPENPKSLPGTTIYDIFIDDDNVLWISAFQNGVSKAPLNNNQFQSIKKQNHSNSLVDNEILSLSADGYGNILIGTGHRGFTWHNPDLGTFQNIPFFKANETGTFINTIYCMVAESKNVYWLGSYSFGLFRADITLANQQTGIYGDIRAFSKIDAFFPDLFEPDKSIPAWAVSDLYIDNENTLWISTLGGLSKYKNGKFEHFFCNLNNGWKENNLAILRVFEDTINRQGTIYLGTETKGIYTLNKNTGDQKKVNLPDKIIKVEDFAIGDSNNLWILSGNLFLVQMDNDNSSGRILLEFDFKNAETNRMCKDANGIIWVASEQGMIRVDPIKNSIWYFTENDGMPSDIFSSCIYHAGRNKVYAGSNNGLVVFNPDEITIPEMNVELNFTGLTIKGNEIWPRDTVNGKVILDKNINALNKVTLRHIDNDFSISFGVSDYRSSSHYQFIYRLVGYENEWRNCPAGYPSANFTNLKPGKYTLEASVRDVNGKPCLNPAKIEIIILPPWWKTLWFRISMVVFILGSIYLIYMQRIKSFMKRQKELEDIVEKRTAEIANQNQELEAQSEELMVTMEELHNANQELEKVNATKNKFFSIIAHDLKNPFNAISGLSSVLNNSFDDLSNDQKKEFIGMIESSSNGASALLENLLTWSRSQTNRIEFKPKNIRLKNIVDETYSLLEVNAHNKQISLITLVSEQDIAFADENMITTVIRNLINNAIKFTPEGGKITVNVEYIKEYICLKITDTGIGMKPEIVEKLFKIDSHNTTKGTSGESGTGLGLIVCREFIEKNNGKIEVVSQVGKGSSFEVYLPLPNNNTNISS